MPPALWKSLILTLVVAVFSGGPAWLHAQPAAAPLADESPFLTEPKTAEEFFDTVVFSVKLARPNLARRYLEGFLALDPDDDTLLTLRDKHGPAIFLRLAGIEELKPIAGELLDRVNAAFRQRGADPARVDALIRDLSGTAHQREVAVIALTSAGKVVIPRMIQVLGDPARAGERDTIVTTIARMGPAVVPPLLGALDSPDPDLRAMVLQALGFTGTRDTAAYLWFHAFGPDQPAGVRLAARAALQRVLKTGDSKSAQVSAFGVAKELRRLATEHYRDQVVWSTEEDGTVELWLWQDDEATIVPMRVSPEAASMFVGSRFARQAFAIAPDQTDVQALYVSLMLSFEAFQAGYDRPLPTGPGTAHDLALASGGDVAGEALSLAMSSGNPRGAVAALQVLGQVGTKHQLSKIDGRQASIVAALNYPDPRVQFAAAMAVLQIDPVTPFSGSSRVVEVLSRSLNDSGTRHSVVTHPSVEKAASLAGLLSELGYAPRIAQTGRDAFRIATEQADVEVIFLDLNTIRWDLSQTVGNLRVDARTASIPIVIFGPESRKGEVASLLRRYPMTTYLVESTTADNLRIQFDPFIRSIRTPPLSPAARAEHASIAAFWLAHLATSGRKVVFSLERAERALIAATDDPALADNAVRALGGIGTQAAQAQLQQVAASEQSPPEMRELAASQLALHIQRHGLLLSLEQVAQVEEAWRTATEPAVSTALAAVVGSMRPNPQRVSGRLQRFAQPVAPPAAAQP